MAETQSTSREDSSAIVWPTLRRLVRASLRHRAVLLASIACGFLLAIARYVRAYLARPLLDEILVPAASMTSAESVDLFRAPLLELGVVAAATVVVSPVAAYGRRYLAEWVVGQVRRDLDQALANKLLRIPLQDLRAKSTGDVLARALGDVTLACEVLIRLYRDVALSAIMVVTSVVALFMTSWPLALIAMAAMPPVVLVLGFFGRRIYRQTTRRQMTLGELSQRLTGILSGIKIIKALRSYRVEEDAFARATDRYLKSSLKIASNRAMSRSATEALTQILGFVTLGFGAWMALNQQQGITLGTLSAFAAILMTTFKPVKSLAGAYSTIMGCLAGAQRLFELLDSEGEAPDRESAQPMPPMREGIRFHHVHFAHGGTPILHDVDLDIRRGEVVAFVGKTGSGKSTLLDLMLRFYDPSSGSIAIDGVDIRDLQRASFLDRIAVVPQEPFLFDISILENIRYGRPEASFEEVCAAAAAAGAAEFIEGLPDGYESLAGEFGLRLSGGQRQRVTIARAILQRSDLLVLDEPTSSLDARTERAVQATIETLRGERTILVVSHRVATTRSADRIFVVDGGRIVDSGTHESLMASSPVYAALTRNSGDAAGGHEGDASSGEAST